MSDISSASHVFSLLAPPIFPSAFTVQQYEVNKAVSNSPIKIAEVKRGVDGIMTAGYVFTPTTMVVTLQADSSTRAKFLDIIEYMKLQRSIVYMTGILTLKGTGEVFTLTKGVFTDYQQIPNIMQTLEATDYNISWEDISPSIF